MPAKKFTMRDEAFTCLVCGQQVTPLRYTARDHCPHCLHSLHVDRLPGDRACSCHGRLVPVARRPHKKASCQIIYRCQTCHQEKANLAASDDNPALLQKLPPA